MVIKEIPTSIKTYYKLMKERTSKKLEDTKVLKDKLEKEIKVQHDELLSNANIYKDNFGVQLTAYTEFNENKYITGTFFKVANGLFINRNNNYELVSDLYDLYKYAKNLKKVNILDKEIEKCNKLLKLSLKEYTEILRAYYTEVHKQLVIHGNGYSFGECIGWICVNRIILRNPKRKIDYAATKKREAELKQQGKRIYNKEEADWCLKNGIEYKAEDKRVFKKDEYCYEIPLISSKLTGGNKLKLEISDYRHSSVRGKTNDDLIKECNSDINKICNLPIDLKTKVTLCDKADTILYTKFIRNETQKSIVAPKINRKD